MRFHAGRWRFSIFMKLALAFFIVIIPVYALALKVSDWGAEIVGNELSDSLRSQVRFYGNSLAKEIDRMVRLQREYVNDDDLMQLSVAAEVLSEYDRTALLKQLQRKLVLIKQSGIYVSEARIYIPPLGRYVTTQDLSETLEPPMLEELRRSNMNRTDSPLIYRDGKLYLREFYPVQPISPTRNPMFVLETELSVAELQRFLSQMTGYRQSGAAIVQRDWTIAGGAADDGVLGPIRADIERVVNGQSEAVQGIETVRVKERTFMTAYAFEPELGATLIVYVPEAEALGELKRYKSFIIAISAVSAIVILLFSYWIYQIIHKPLAKMVRAFRKVESGELLVSLHHRSRDEFSYLYEKFNEMTVKLRTLIFEAYERKLQAQQAELKQLQSQINPHFLYNSLYLLYRMTKAHDYDNSLKMTKHLGDYFQYITRKTGDDVTLGEEWNHARMYAEIQQLRFSNRIALDFGELPPGSGEWTVPRLILQPLVENAYNHGLEHTLTDGRLIVAATRHAGELRIAISDNGAGMSPAELERWKRLLADDQTSGDMNGMINVHRRLRLRFGPLAGLAIEPLPEGGMRIVLHIPLANAKEVG